MNNLKIYSDFILYNAKILPWNSSYLCLSLTQKNTCNLIPREKYNIGRICTVLNTFTL